MSGFSCSFSSSASCNEKNTQDEDKREINMSTLKSFHDHSSLSVSMMNTFFVSDQVFSWVLNSDYSMVIRFFTPFTPFTSLASLAARFDSAALLAFPYNVTTPLFVSTLVLRALVDR